LKISFQIGRVIVPGTPGEWVFPDRRIEVRVKRESDIPAAAARVAAAETERLGTPQRVYSWQRVKFLGSLGESHLL
jgi:hypothetical protein